MKNKIWGFALIIAFLCSCQSNEEAAEDLYNQGVEQSLQAGKLLEEGKTMDGNIALNQAIEKFEQTLEIDSTHQLAESAAAFCFYQLQSYKLAELWYRRAIEKTPETSVNQQYLGLSLVNMDRLQESMEYLDQAIELDESVKDNIVVELLKIANTAIEIGAENEVAGLPEKQAEYQSFAIGVLLTAYQYAPENEFVTKELTEAAELVNDQKLLDWLKE